MPFSDAIGIARRGTVRAPRFPDAAPLTLYAAHDVRRPPTKRARHPRSSSARVAALPRPPALLKVECALYLVPPCDLKGSVAHAFALWGALAGTVSAERAPRLVLAVGHGR